LASGGQQDENEIGCPPGVEHDGGKQQHQIASLGRDKEVDHKKEWQEIEEEYVAAEYHREELRIEK
jgi:hypothetical protein